MSYLKRRFYLLSFFVALLVVAAPRVALAEEPAPDSRASLSTNVESSAKPTKVFYGYGYYPSRVVSAFVPSPSHESENELLRVIRECKDKMEVFPYELVVYPKLTWDVRFDLTPSVFEVFHRYKEAVIDASYEDLLGCAYMIDDLSEKEQAMVLVALRLFEEARRVAPDDPQRALANKNPFIRYRQAPTFRTLQEKEWNFLHKIIASFADNEQTAFPAYAPNDIEMKWEKEFRTRCGTFFMSERERFSSEGAKKAEGSDLASDDATREKKWRAKIRQEFFESLGTGDYVSWESACDRFSIHFLYATALMATQPESLAVTLPMIRNEERIRSNFYSVSPGRFPAIYFIKPDREYEIFREYLLTQFCAERQGLHDVKFAELYVNKSERDLTLGKIARDLINHPHGGKRRE